MHKRYPSVDIRVVLLSIMRNSSGHIVEHIASECNTLSIIQPLLRQSLTASSTFSSMLVLDTNLNKEYARQRGFISKNIIVTNARIHALHVTSHDRPVIGNEVRASLGCWCT